MAGKRIGVAAALAGLVWLGGAAGGGAQTSTEGGSVKPMPSTTQPGGVPRPAVSTAGYGEGRPVAPNSTPDGRDDPDGRQRNRRVELLVTPR